MLDALNQTDEGQEVEVLTEVLMNCSEATHKALRRKLGEWLD